MQVSGFTSFFLLLCLPFSLFSAVSFSDSKLERAVLTALGRSSGAVSEAELAGLKKLDASFHGISDLGGLEGSRSITKLNLFGNALTDLSPLSGLTTLEDLDLGANKIISVNSLSGLTGLAWLRLDLNPVDDLSPLSGVVHLKQLSVNGTEVADLVFLSSMNNLVCLRAANNRIESADILSSSFNSLAELDLSGNRLTSATFVDGLPSLTSLDLQENYLVETGWPDGGATAAVEPGHWYHVAVVVDGGTTIEPGSLNVYFEGSLLGTGSGSQLWPHGADIGIGAMVYQTRFPDIQPDGDGYYFDGSIDEVRIYHRPLSPAEISDLAVGGGPGDMAVRWPFDGNAEDAVSDNDGSVAGNLTFALGVLGQALVLDGDGDHISVPDSSEINLRTSAQYTVSLFFKANKTSATRQVLYEQGGRTRGLNLYLENGLFIAGAWNDIETESLWSGSWIGDSSYRQLTRLNLSGNRLQSITVPLGSTPSDWDVSYNQFHDLTDFGGLSNNGTLRIEGNFFDPALEPTVETLEVAGVEVMGTFPSAHLDYDTWRSVYFSAISTDDDLVSGPLVDPDLDGLVNLLECAFGGDPLVSDLAYTTPVQVISGDSVMNYRYTDHCPQIQLMVLESSTLQSGTWTPAIGTVAIDPISSGWTFRKTVPEGGEPVFLRIEATLP